VNYPDGALVEPGDVVLLDGKDCGRVVASIDTGRFLPEHGGWGYLGQGVIVDTDFAGFVHYTSQTIGSIALVERGSH
jgi:hypothetical protein